MSAPCRIGGVIGVFVVLSVLGICLLAIKAFRSHTEADIDRDVNP